MRNDKMKTYFELNIIEKFCVLFSKFYFRIFIFSLIISLMRDIIVKFIYKFLDYKLIETNYSQKIINIGDKFVIIDKIILNLGFCILIIFMLKLLYISFKFKNFNKMINNSFINITKEYEENYINYFKKNYKYLEFKEELLAYDLMVANITLKPSEFINFYNNKLENNKFYVFENNYKKVNCFINYHFTYFIMYYLNKIILGENIKFNGIKFYRKVLSTIRKEKHLFIVKLIEYYNEKNYEQIYNLLFEYYSIYKYDLSKSILVFLYISAEKIGKDINFLPEITKQKMYDTVKEEEFRQFVEKELS